MKFKSLFHIGAGKEKEPSKEIQGGIYTLWLTRTYDESRPTWDHVPFGMIYAKARCTTAPSIEDNILEILLNAGVMTKDEMDSFAEQYQKYPEIVLMEIKDQSQEYWREPFRED